MLDQASLKDELEPIAAKMKEYCRMVGISGAEHSCQVSMRNADVVLNPGEERLSIGGIPAVAYHAFLPLLEISRIKVDEWRESATEMRIRFQPDLTSEKLATLGELLGDEINRLSDFERMKQLAQEFNDISGADRERALNNLRTLISEMNVPGRLKAQIFSAIRATAQQESRQPA